MKVTHFEPWSLVNQLHRDFGRIAPVAASNRARKQWFPAVDIVDEQDRFVLRADLPGVAIEDIDVSTDAGVLSVTGERTETGNDEGTKRHRVERATGRFERRFNLPETADAEKISAKNSNGVLEISIPKLPEIQARRISVEAA